MQYKYIFYIPHYQSNSNGITSLWEAALYFSQYRDVTICDFHNGVDCSDIPEKFNKIKRFTGDDIWKLKLSKYHIIVYPDVVTDNPFNHTNVARYLMCKPYILNGLGYNMSQYDYCFAYSKAVSEILPQYTIINREVAKIKKIPHKVKTNKVTLYFGKTRAGLSFKGLNKLLENFDEIDVISRGYPSTKEQMYNMISESRLLISFDSLSSVIHESTLLGTPVYVFDKAFRNLYNNFNFKLHGLYYDVQTKDLERIYNESHNLHIKAKNEILKFNNSMLQRTKDLLEDIENHIINKKTSADLYRRNMDIDRKFYKNGWEYAAIFNINSKTTLIRYLIINKFGAFGILIFILNRSRIRLMSNLDLFFNKLYLFFNKLYLFFNLYDYMLKNITQEEKDTLKNLLGRNHNLELKLKNRYIVDSTTRECTTKTKNDNIEIKNDINAVEIKITKFIKQLWK